MNGAGKEADAEAQQSEQTSGGLPLGWSWRDRPGEEKNVSPAGGKGCIPGGTTGGGVST